MKKKMVVFYSLMFLPLVVVLIALQFLPEQIPAHYDMNNQVTRWGSKYETLIFPVITVLFGYFMLAMAKLSSKQETIFYKGIMPSETGFRFSSGL